MTEAKFYFYIGLIFFIITLIGSGFLVFGIYIISTYEQPISIAFNIIIVGIVLLPIGVIFAIVFFKQCISTRNKEKKTE